MEPKRSASKLGTAEQKYHSTCTKRLRNNVTYTEDVKVFPGVSFRIMMNFDKSTSAKDKTNQLARLSIISNIRTYSFILFILLNYCGNETNFKFIGRRQSHVCLTSKKNKKLRLNRPSQPNSKKHNLLTTCMQIL